jgi:hypothetical protein
MRNINFFRILTKGIHWDKGSGRSHLSDLCIGLYRLKHRRIFKCSYTQQMELISKKDFITSLVFIIVSGVALGAASHVVDVVTLSTLALLGM